MLKPSSTKTCASRCGMWAANTRQVKHPATAQLLRIMAPLQPPCKQCGAGAADRCRQPIMLVQHWLTASVSTALRLQIRPLWRHYYHNTQVGAPGGAWLLDGQPEVPRGAAVPAASPCGRPLHTSSKTAHLPPKQGLIFVVDSQENRERMEEAREELHRVLQDVRPRCVFEGLRVWSFLGLFAMVLGSTGRPAAHAGPECKR